MKVRYLILVMALVAGLAFPAFAQQPADHQATPPLVQLLQSKGILTADEAAQLSHASSADDANAQLARLLVQKGLISTDDYSRMVAPSAVPASDDTSGTGHFLNAIIHIPTKASEPTPASSDPYTFGAPSEGGVIPAVSPVRALPIDVPKQGGLIPDIKLGSGANMKVYGFFKASAVEQTASSGGAINGGGQDFPLPLMLGDTGPKSDPYFLIKARSFRVGSQFEWVPKNSDLVITGRLETDFEGDYTTVDNRSISSVRSNQLSLRLAYVRLDTHWGEMPVFAEIGQDWSLLGSSTLPNIYETTGLMVGYGSLYERMPQFKIGAQIIHSGDFKVQPEFAIVEPVSADSTLTELQRTGFGDRAGADSNEPGVEGRVVFQFPLSHSWQAVPPAQIIFSGHHATINEIVTHGASTATPAPSLTALGGSNGLSGTVIPGAACANGGDSLATCFPHGVQVSYPQNIWSAEVQLPTPWVTIDGQYHNGDDMRFFFAGQLNSAFATPGAGLATAGTATSFSGATIDFGCPSGLGLPIPTTCNGPVTTGALNPIRGQGGFVEASFPLSRIFHAEPEGKNAGWVFHVLYGTDRAKAEDARHGGGLVRSDYDTGSLSYKINRWVSFVNEVTYLSTQAATDAQDTGEPKLFQGRPATKAHGIREEFGTVVTF
ncbi:MAG: hypothetical protein WB780_07125 [Candidatus Acidiferrales bacterium]